MQLHCLSHMHQDTSPIPRFADDLQTCIDGSETFAHGCKTSLVFFISHIKSAAVICNGKVDSFACILQSDGQFRSPCMVPGVVKRFLADAKKIGLCLHGEDRLITVCNDPAFNTR